MFITPDSLFIRLSNLDTWSLLFYRGAIPFVVVLFGLVLFYRSNFFSALFKIGYTGIFYIISFSLCNITFIISIQNQLVYLCQVITLVTLLALKPLQTLYLK